MPFEYPAQGIKNTNLTFTVIFHNTKDKGKIVKSSGKKWEKQQMHTRMGNDNATKFPNGNAGRLKTVSIVSFIPSQKLVK